MAIPCQTRTPESIGRVRLALLLGSVVALGPLTIDMYLPALPDITADLAAGPTAVQLTLTGTLLGLAIGQLVVGPLADALGRRGPLLAGVGVHIAASLLCAIAPDVAVLGALRLVQGLGAAAGAVVALAMVRDLFTGRAAAVMLSRLILVMGAAPVLAPTLGGAVLRWTDWRGVFVVLAAFGLVLVTVAAVLLPETLPRERRRPAGLGPTLRTYAGLLTDRPYVGLVMVTGLSMAGLLAYVAGSSFVLQQEYGLDRLQFALLFGAGAVWLILATQLTPWLLRRFEPHQVLTVAVAGGTAAAVALVVAAATGAGGLPLLLALLWAVLAAVGFTLPNAAAIALGRHGEAAGSAAALLGFVQFGVGAVVSPVVGLLGNDAVAMAVVIGAGMTLALLGLGVVARPWREATPEPAVPVPAA